MDKVFACVLFSISFLLPLGAIDATNNGASPSEVITRLLANASTKPLGPVENDVTEQTVQNAKAAEADSKSKGSAESLRESIVDDYIAFTLNGPLTSLYSDSRAAILYGEVKLTEDELASHDATPSVVGFSESGGFSSWVGSKVRDEAHVIATFGLVQQHGGWKVHCVYLSNDVMEGSDKAFIIRQLAAFAEKQ